MKLDWSLLVIILVVVAAVWVLVRMRGPGRNPRKLNMAMELISCINDALKRINTPPADSKAPKKFRIGPWAVYQTHLDFLEPEYKEYVQPIKDSFNLMQEYNNKLIAYKANPSGNPPELPLDTFKENLLQGRAGLAKWIQANINRETTRGFLGWGS
jgi:hypothetical protein